MESCDLGQQFRFTDCCDNTDEKPSVAALCFPDTNHGTDANMTHTHTHTQRQTAATHMTKKHAASVHHFPFSVAASSSEVLEAAEIKKHRCYSEKLNFC